MNTAVVTSTPVVVAPAKRKHPVVTNKGTICGIGITGILIGLYAIGFGAYYLCGSAYVDDYFVALYSYGWLLVGGGVWFIIAGSLAIAASASPTNCHIVGGNVVSILACLAAFGLGAKQLAVVLPMIQLCANIDCSLAAGMIFAHVLLLLLAIIEFILTIIHASFSCGCCGKSYSPQVPTAMTVTSTRYGPGYAPLYNEPVAYAAPNGPQKTLLSAYA